MKIQRAITNELATWLGLTILFALFPLMQLLMYRNSVAQVLVVSLLIPTAYFIVALMISNYVRRAIFIKLLSLGSFYLCVLPLTCSFALSAAQIGVETRNYLVLGGLTGSILGLLFRIRSEIINVREAIPDNEKAGVLDMERGIFDITIPFLYATLEKWEGEKSIVRLVQHIALPLLPLLGVLVISGSDLLTFDFIVAAGTMLFICVFIITSARLIAVIVELVSIEKKIARPVMIKKIRVLKKDAGVG